MMSHHNGMQISIHINPIYQDHDSDPVVKSTSLSESGSGSGIGRSTGSSSNTTNTNTTKNSSSTFNTLKTPSHTPTGTVNTHNRHTTHSTHSNNSTNSVSTISSNSPARQSTIEFIMKMLPKKWAKYILKTWKYNGMAIIFVITFCLTTLIVAPMVFQIFYVTYGESVHGGEEFAECLIQASFSSISSGVPQDQESVNTYASNICGDVPENRPNQFLVRVYMYVGYM